MSKHNTGAFSPIKKYANQHGWSDVTPFEIIGRSARTLTLRRMKVERDPDWKPEVIPGGFAGTCVNQNKQKWNISSDETELVIKAYLRKDGRHMRFYSSLGRHSLHDEPIYFYDYNF